MACDALRAEMLETLRRLLADVLRLRDGGAAYDRLGRAQGFLDGYMCAALDAGLVTKAELLELAQLQRERLGGAATGEVTVDSSSAATIAA